MKKVGNALSLL